MYEILQNPHLGGSCELENTCMASIFLRKFMRALYPAEAFASQSEVLCFGASRAVCY